MVDEYKSLAEIKKLKFEGKVTIGFKKIKQGAVIGVCTYGGRFREIDLDIDFWNNSNHMSKLALVFHELSHCYCGRDHDYGDGKAYPEKEEERVIVALNWRAQGGERPGYWEDGCPVSLMHPTLPDSECITAHYAEYTQEMFNRCESW